MAEDERPGRAGGGARNPRGGGRGSAGGESRGAGRPGRAGSWREGDRPRGSGRGAPRGGRGATGADAGRRPGAAPEPSAPPVPEDVLPTDLDRAARSRLRTLSKQNADGVARHLVMAGRLLEEDPELAYEHAQAAVRRAGRVDVVREAAAITAYVTGRYAEALRELRTVRRLNGSDEHLPLMADCERGLGRPERALVLAREDAARTLPADLQVELAIVASGARLDLGEPEAALLELRAPVVGTARGNLAARVAEARATALEAAGRHDEAAAERARVPVALRVDEPDEHVVVVDLADDEPGDAETDERDEVLKEER